MKWNDVAEVEELLATEFTDNADNANIFSEFLGTSLGLE